MAAILLKLEHPQRQEADAAETNCEDNAPNSTLLSGGIKSYLHILELLRCVRSTDFTSAFTFTNHFRIQIYQCTGFEDFARQCNDGGGGCEKYLYPF
jgi:hypothetical protein